MAVDFLRSCHTQTARMVQDNADVAVLRWFFSPLAAKLLPIPTSFGSLVWESDDRVIGAIGQVDRFIIWDKGLNRGYCGQTFQGQPAWFVEGIPAAQLLLPPPTIVCGAPGFTAIGGAEANGVAHFMDSSMTAVGGIEANGSAAFHDNSLDALGGVEGNGSASFMAPDFNAVGGVEADGLGHVDT